MLIVTQLVNKVPAFHETWRFITLCVCVCSNLLRHRNMSYNTIQYFKYTHQSAN